EGNDITAHASPDGEKWEEIGTRTIELNESVYVGFAVDGAKNSNDINHYNTAVFSDVSTTMTRVDGTEEPEEPEEPKEPQVIFEDEFTNATTENITTPEYMSLPEDESKPMYMNRAGKLEADSGQISMTGRFTIGAKEGVDTTED